jgi:hypothetical protein
MVLHLTNHTKKKKTFCLPEAAVPSLTNYVLPAEVTTGEHLPQLTNNVKI